MWLGIEVLPLFYQSQSLVYCYYTNPQWSGRRDLNPQHPVWKTGALPIELLPHGAAVGIRTLSLRITNPLLCQLSYDGWCGRWDSNPQSQRATVFKTVSYANSDTSARCVCLTSCIFVRLLFHYIKIMNRVKIQNKQT